MANRKNRRRLILEPLEGRRLLAVATDLANLAGRVFDDLTGDGFTTGEQVAGANLNLYRGDGDGQFEPGSGDTEIRTTTTDANGNYLFERLTAGQYFVLQPEQTVNGRTLPRSVSPPITITADQVAGRLIRTIDGFDQTFQSVIDETNDNTPVTSTAAAPEAIGGSRDLLVDKTSDIGSVQLIVNDPVSPNLLQIASEAFGSGRRIVIWDGAGDDPAVVDDGGLGTIDLTNGGQAAGLRLVVGADLPSGAAVVRLYSDDGSTSTRGRVSEATLNIPALTTQPTSVEFLPFAQFSTRPGATGGADLANIGAIEFEVIAGPNYDALADLIGTIGPNVINVPDFDNFQSADLRLSKQLTTAVANVNQPVTFLLSLTNDGPDTATGIVVTDNLPAGITYQTNQTSIGTFTPGNGQWSIASLPVGATATLSITGLLTASTPQTNTAEVTAAQQFDPDSTPGNSTAGEDDQATVVVTPSQIDLSLTKTVSDASPNVDDPVSFTLTLTNSGGSAATNVVVEDRLPAGLVLTGNTPSTGTFNASNRRWSIPSLAAGGTATLVLETRVASPGNLVNVAEVIAADQFDIDSTPGNNLDAEDDQASAIVQTRTSDLSIDKTLVTPGSTIGDNVTFTIVVNNAGPDPATGVRVRDVLPAGLAYVSDSPSVGDYDPATGIWTIPAVPVGATNNATLTLVASLQNAISQTNTAEIIAADQFDPDSTPGNANATEDDIDSVVVTPITVDLDLTKTVSLARPVPGETFTYTLNVRNTSQNDATGVVVRDPLPGGIIFQSNTADQVYSPTTGTWTVGNVPAGATRTIEIQAILNPNRADILSPISNTAEITATDQFDIDSTPGNVIAGEDDQASATVTPARADLRLSKSASNPQANVGQEVTFTISTTNDGPDPSGVFTVSDPVPTGASLVRSTPSIGSYDSATGIWTVPGLGTNQTATLAIVLQTASPGSINNVAQISSASLPDPDSTPGNSVPGEDDQDDASIQSQAINLSLQKSVDKATPRIGETFRYTIEVTNSGPDTATNVVIGETIPAPITLVSSLPESGTFVTSTRRWSIPSLAAGATTRLFLDARIDSIAGLPSGGLSNDLTNTAEVLSVDQVDTNSTPGNNDPAEDDQDSATVRVAIADISLTKTSLTPAPNVGDLARFEIVVSNAGPDVATNLVIRDVLPNGLVYRSDTQSDTAGDYNNVTGLWTIPSLGVGQTTSLQINADVTSSGSFTNTAELIEVGQDDPDSIPGNNRIDEDDQATAVITTPIIDLSLSKTVDPSRPSVGSEVTFTLTATNAGPDTATGVVVRDTLPVGFQFVSADPSPAFVSNDGIWTVGTLASGESRSLLVRGTVTATELFDNRAEIIEADQFDRDSTPGNGFNNGEDDAVIVPVTPASADLSLTKTINDATPNVGQDVTFTLTVRNDGPDVANNIEVLESLPGGLTNIRSQTASGTYSNSDQIWRLPELRVGATATLSLIGTVDFDANNTTSPITRTNSAEIIASSQRDPDSTPNNQSTNEDDDATVEFVPQLIDLALTKTIDNNRPNVGQTVAYEVSLTNDGPSDATGIVVADPLPAGLTFVSASPEVGSYNQSTGRWSINQLNAGATARLILRASVAPNANNVDAILRDGIVNTAEVFAADQPDRDSTPGNNVENEDDFASVLLTFPRADLSLTKTVDNPNPDQDEFVEFLVTLNNAGPDPASGIVVQETIPPGLGDVTVTPLEGSYNAATNRWTVDTLPPNQSASLQVRGRITSSAILNNAAEIIAADQFDPDSVPGNGQPTEDDLASVAVTPQVVDLNVTATADPQEVIAGDTFTLTVTVRNGQTITPSTLTQITPLVTDINRPISDASGVVVGIDIPAGLTLLAVDPTSAVFDPQTGRWVVGDLPNGQSQQLRLTFLVESASVKSFEIEVLEANEFDIDSNPGNNIPAEDDQTSVTVRPPRTLSKRLFLSR
ncbi:SpaA isopeptide-forming pilin-related protein [Neorhodopirellula pilleata]|uniref:DUF11 domain-containing protein n=1 Tax=Neorhodopirellula pilleata TaxID=2714738 RepID=A0A5C6B0G1_9BACT|nr:SpaA isopeptide-forming pilin-related protein [Neorhodopirellula pilleata]TWU03904.1 hypothetical protein Pla100_08390 [Neorhodopirellula pilleata]